uniref:Uncharacterized protein n=1 Tax=Arundo donax TaxID=35708 RepID=A0A0A9HFN4_ARUDO
MQGNAWISTGRRSLESWGLINHVLSSFLFLVLRTLAYLWLVLWILLSVARSGCRFYCRSFSSL